MLTSIRRVSIPIALSLVSLGSCTTESQADLPGRHETAQARGDSSPPADHPRWLDLRVQPFVDEYWYLRRLSLLNECVPPSQEGQLAVDALRELQAQFTLPLAWAPLEGLLASCTSVQDLPAVLARAPEVVDLQSGESLRLREAAVKLGKLLVAAAPAFEAKVWPAHKIAIESALRRIESDFAPKEDLCFDFIQKSLGTSSPALPIPVYLVAEAPHPGAITHADESGRGVCFVAVSGAEGSQLFEEILHEATHALDIASKKSALDDLRARLEQAGLGPRDHELRDFPHTLMFIQAGETVRRLVDPAHRHYGDVAGYYAKIPRAAEIERPLWIAHLDGKITRAEALDDIVRSLLEMRDAKR